MATTPNLGLTTYDVASGSATTFLAFRTALDGTVSNMSIIDTAYNNIYAAINALRSTSIYTINGTQVSSNYYTATVTSLSSYSTGMTINLSINVANTGAVTLNLNSIGVVTLKKSNNSGSLVDIDSGDMTVNKYYTFIYNGAYFVLTAANNVTVPSNIVGEGVLSTTSGSVAKHNVSGVTSGSYNKVLVDSWGHIISGSVVDFTSGSIYAGVSPISITGSMISHSTSGAGAGSYLAANVTVDDKGHITSISNGVSASSVGAPSDNPFITSGSSSSLSNYKVLTAGSNVTINMSGSSIFINSSGTSSGIGGGLSVGANAYNSASQVCSNGSALKILFDSNIYDTDSIHSTTVNLDRFTCNTAGKYIVNAHIEFSPNSTGFRQIYIMRNDADYVAVDERIPRGDGATTNCNLSTILDMQIGDWVNIYADQNSGTSLNIRAADGGSYPYACSLQIQKIDGNGTSMGFPSCILGSTGSLSIPNIADTAISFSGSEVILDANSWYSSASPSRITLDSAGVYQAFGQLQFQTGGGTARWIWINKSGSMVATTVMNPGSQRFGSAVYAPFTAIPGDYIELFCYQDSGSSLATASQYLTVQKVSDIAVIDTVALTGWVPVSESWSYLSADSPSFEISITGDKTSKYSPGMKVRLTQTTVKYFIITKVEYIGPNTVITIYGGTDYTLDNAVISYPYYSMVKSPQGFSLSPAKWSVITSGSISSSQLSPTQDVWYNINSYSISVPIGLWNFGFKGSVYTFGGVVAGTYNIFSTLSKSSSSEDNNDYTTFIQSTTNSAGDFGSSIYVNNLEDVSSKTTYYFIHKTDQTNNSGIYVLGGTSKLKIFAVSAYL